MFGLSDSMIYEIVVQASQRSGMPMIRPHDLRRTCAKLMRSGGASVEQISEILGHSSISTTERYLGTKLVLERGLAATDLAGDPTR
jgi:integrase